MKILHLSSEKSFRGGEEEISYLISSQSSQIEHIVLSRKNSAFSRHCEERQFKYHETGFKNHFDLLSAWAIKKTIKNMDIDIIHAHSSKSHSIAALGANLGWIKKPIIVTKKTNFKINNKQKYNSKKITKIIVISKMIAKSIRDVIEDKLKVSLIYSGVNIDENSKSISNDDKERLKKLKEIGLNKKIIMNTSALTSEKGMVDFINIAKSVIKSKKNVCFVNCGSGDLREKLERRIEENQLADHILLFDFTAHIIKFMKEADIFLMTSYSEGVPLSIMKSMLLEIPVIATDVGGIPEAIVNKETGLLFEPGNIKKASEKLCLLLEDEDLYKKLQAKAKQTALENFSIKSMIRNHEELYLGLN